MDEPRTHVSMITERDEQVEAISTATPPASRGDGLRGCAYQRGGPARPSRRAGLGTIGHELCTVSVDKLRPAHGRRCASRPIASALVHAGALSARPRTPRERGGVPPGRRAAPPPWALARLRSYRPAARRTCSLNFRGRSPGVRTSTEIPRACSSSIGVHQQIKVTRVDIVATGG